MTQEYRVYLSDRGHPLLFMGQPIGSAVLTLENYTKWYELYLVYPDASVKKVDVVAVQEVMEENPNAFWYDHLYHPQLLYSLATKLGAELDERALEVAIGRWMLEGPDDCKTATELKFTEPEG